MSTMTLYWLLRLDAIKNVMTGGLIASCVLLGVFILLHLIFAALYKTDVNWAKKYPDNNGFKKDAARSNVLYNSWKNKWIIIIPFVVFFSLAEMFIPTTKQMAILVVVPKVINNEKIKQLPDKMLDLATEWLEELKPDKKEK